MIPPISSRKELLDLWSKQDKGKGEVLFPPDLSALGGPPSRLSKAYKRLWLDFSGNSLYLDSILKKGWRHTPRTWRRLLALAFSELQWSSEKDIHGVVHDWVQLTREQLGEKAVKVINGTLRTATRHLGEDKAPRQGLPRQLEVLLGGREGRLLLDRPHPIFAFSLSQDLTDTPSREGVLVGDHPGLGTIYQLQPGTSPKEWSQKNKGFVQNLSAAEVALEVQRRFLGSSLLDYCAAPGGKSWQLLRLGIPNLTVHDHAPKRQQMMMNSPMGLATKNRLSQLSADASILFDGILIDVPCSNSGVLSKCPEAVRHYWQPTTDFGNIQEEVFLSSLNFLKPGAQLFYSTCSIDPAENQDRIAHLAGRYGLNVVFQKSWFPDERGRHGAFLAELMNCE